MWFLSQQCWLSCIWEWRHKTYLRVWTDVYVQYDANNYFSSFKMCQRHSSGRVKDSHYFSNHIQFEWHHVSWTTQKCKFLCVLLCCAKPNRYGKLMECITDGINLSNGTAIIELTNNPKLRTTYKLCIEYALRWDKEAIASDPLCVTEQCSTINQTILGFVFHASTWYTDLRISLFTSLVSIS